MIKFPNFLRGLGRNGANTLHARISRQHRSFRFFWTRKTSSIGDETRLPFLNLSTFKPKVNTLIHEQLRFVCLICVDNLIVVISFAIHLAHLWYFNDGF